MKWVISKTKSDTELTKRKWMFTWNNNVVTGNPILQLLEDISYRNKQHSWKM